VWSLENDTITELTVRPADFGLSEHPLSEVAGGDAQHNSKLMTDLLTGVITEGPIFDFVMLNSAALLYVAGKAASLKDAVQLAKESLSSGRALAALQAFRDRVKQ
jgi:anthranilate phosphoribosyltransferase